MSKFIVNEYMFGRYCRIKTDFSDNMHIYKIVALLESNNYCDVPLCGNSEPTLHRDVVPVLLVIHCGIDETKVHRVALSDCEVQPTADVVKVVHCKDCKYFQDKYVELPDGSKRPYKKGESIVPLSAETNVGSYCTRIDYAIVHGYRNGEPSVDETRLWTKPDGFCSYGERKDEE